ncbi:hypothetical protein OG427_28040 [Streptomyces sp. NBC_00133]|uniref:hypothetical protein n=1 Tax=Streptomyces sp. NBC_00133 TaxID=2903624 RepID=UPI00324FC840
MTAPLSCRTPGSSVCPALSDASDWAPFGRPSADLVARAEAGWEKFLCRGEAVEQEPDEGGE